jgi:hypothetical protein
VSVRVRAGTDVTMSALRQEHAELVARLRAADIDAADVRLIEQLLSSVAAGSATAIASAELEALRNEMKQELAQQTRAVVGLRADLKALRLELVGPVGLKQELADGPDTGSDASRSTPAEEDLRADHTADEATAPSRSRTPERGPDGKTMKEHALSSQSLTPDHGADRRMQLEDRAPSRAEVVQEYQAEGDGEISIAIGDVVRVIDDTDADWWEGHLEGVSHVDSTGYFPAAFVRIIDDDVGAAESRLSKAKQKLEHKPRPPPKIEPWEDPESDEYDPVRVQANAAFRQQHADGANAATTKKQKQLAAINKKQAEAKALKAAEAKFSPEQTAQLEQLDAEEKRLLAEYQRAFADDGISKAQIQAASKAYAAAQAEAKAYRQAAIGAIRQHSSSGASSADQAAADHVGATRNCAGGVALPPKANALQQAGGEAKKIGVKDFLAERGLSDWYRPLSLHGGIIRVSQLESITQRYDRLPPSADIILMKFENSVNCRTYHPSAENCCKLRRRRSCH